MGYLANRKNDKGEKLDIPKIDALGTCGTWGLGALIVGYYTGYWPINDVAQGLLSVQAYEFGAQMAESKVQLTGDEDMEGMEVLGEGEI